VNTLAEFGTGQLFWSMIWFTLFFIWIWIVITCFMDIFRDDELSGWGKAGWCIFIIVVPYLAVFIYLIARGSGMQKRQMAAAVANAEAQRAYIQSVAGPASVTGSVSEELTRLADLRAKGAITDEEFAALKAKAMA
jgi:ABC-type multidrug transport system fused ATPase/permease subunit